MNSGTYVKGRDTKCCKQKYYGQKGVFGKEKREKEKKNSKKDILTAILNSSKKRKKCRRANYVPMQYNSLMLFSVKWGQLWAHWPY